MHLADFNPSISCSLKDNKRIHFTYERVWYFWIKRNQSVDEDSLAVVKEFVSLGTWYPVNMVPKRCASERICAASHKLETCIVRYCAQRVCQIGVKGMPYRTCVRPATLYVSETWAIKVEDVWCLCTPLKCDEPCQETEGQEAMRSD